MFHLCKRNLHFPCSVLIRFKADHITRSSSNPGTCRYDCFFFNRRKVIHARATKCTRSGFRFTIFIINYYVRVRTVGGPIKINCLHSKCSEVSRRVIGEQSNIFHVVSLYTLTRSCVRAQ